MFKCCNCGHLFEEDERARWSESRGEFWGASCSEEMTGCPICEGEYEEAVRCEICGKYSFEDELTDGVCEDCIEEYRYNIDVCNNIGNKILADVQLNGFLASMFSKEEIEEILFKELKEAQKYKQIDCKPFIDEDRSWFVERLIEEVKD